ncbi:MAG: hypothetical protein ACK4ND_04010 [Cytophagaceae bacterium]
MKNLILIVTLIFLGSMNTAQAQFMKKDPHKDLLSVKVKEKNNKKSRKFRTDERVKKLKKKDKANKATAKRIQKKKKQREMARQKRVNKNRAIYGNKETRYNSSHVAVPSLKN